MLSVSCTGEGGSRVVTLREVKRIKESAARVTGAKAVFTFNHIVGASPALQNVIQMARKAAKSDATTLILGESGTGKELFRRVDAQRQQPGYGSVHYRELRSSSPRAGAE